MHTYEPRADSSSNAYPVAPFWLVSKEKLREEGNRSALTLLDILMFLDNDNIPASAFNIPSKVPEDFPGLQRLANRVDFLEASGSLMCHSLISKDDAKQNFSIHPTIHTAIYESMTTAEKKTASIIAAFILSSQFPGKSRGGEDIQVR